MLSIEQQQAKEFIETSSAPIISLMGYAGTGKTFLLGEISTYRTGICAPTHKAVGVLKSKVPVYSFASTIHSALGMKEKLNRDGSISFVPDYTSPNRDRLSDINLLVIDESSMVDEPMYKYIEDAQEEFGFRVLFVGDPFQIPPVNVGKHSIPCSLEECERRGIPTFTLTSIIRQAEGNSIISLSMNIREKGSRGAFMEDYEHTETSGVEVVSPSRLLRLVNEHYNPEDIDSFRTIAYHNYVVDKSNHSIRKHILGEDYRRDALVGDRLVLSSPLLEGNLILLNNNDEVEVIKLEEVADDVTIINEDYPVTYYRATLVDLSSGRTVIAKILSKDSEGIVREVSDMLVTVAKQQPPGSMEAYSAWKEFYAFKGTFLDYKYSFAITAHKSQGSTYAVTAIMVKDILRADPSEADHILYTAVTRASNKVYLIV